MADPLSEERLAEIEQRCANDKMLTFAVSVGTALAIVASCDDDIEELVAEVRRLQQEVTELTTELGAARDH